MAKEIAVVGGVFLVVTLAIAYIYGVTDLALVGDNEHYFFMAERVASGFSPYHSQFEAKQGLSMVLTGMVIALGRPLGMPDLAMARVLSVTVLGLSLWLTWWLTFLLTGSRRAASFAGLAMIAFSGYLYQAAMGSRPKVLLVLFMLLTMLLFVQRRLFWAGVTSALAFLSWQPALLMLGVMLLVLLSGADRVEPIKRVLAGALLTVVTYQLYFLLDGSMGEQLLQTYYFPATYMRHRLSWVIERLHLLPQHWVEGFGRFNLLPLVAGLGLVGSGIGWLRRRRQGERPADGPSREWLYVSLCFAGWVLFTVYDHQGYMDLFVLLPFLAILVGATLERWVTRRGKPIWEQVGVGAVLLGFGLLIYQGAQMQRTDFGLREQQLLATRVGRMLEEGEKIYAIECTHLLAFNRAENWSKFGFFFRGVGRYLRAEKKGRGALRLDRNGDRPSVVLVSHHMPREIRRELRRSYREVFDCEFEDQGIRVFRLNSRRNSRPGSWLLPADDGEMSALGPGDGGQGNTPIEGGQTATLFYGKGQEVGVGDLLGSGDVDRIDQRRLTEGQGVGPKHVIAALAKVSYPFESVRDRDSPAGVGGARYHSDKTVFGQGTGGPAVGPGLPKPLVGGFVMDVSSVEEGHEHVDVEQMDHSSSALSPRPEGYRPPHW